MRRMGKSKKRKFLFRRYFYIFWDTFAQLPSKNLLMCAMSIYFVGSFLFFRCVLVSMKCKKAVEKWKTNQGEKFSSVGAIFASNFASMFWNVCWWKKNLFLIFAHSSPTFYWFAFGITFMMYVWSFLIISLKMEEVCLMALQRDPPSKVRPEKNRIWLAWITQQPPPHTLQLALNFANRKL